MNIYLAKTSDFFQEVRKKYLSAQKFEKKEQGVHLQFKIQKMVEETLKNVFVHIY